MQTNINTGFSHSSQSAPYSPNGNMQAISESDFLSFITIKKGLAKQSIRHCRIRLRIINIWLQNKKLTKENVELFFLEQRNRGLANNSLNTYYFVFRQIVDYCKDRNLPFDFLDGFKSFKKTKAEIIIFTSEEIESLINAHPSYGRLAGVDCSFLDLRYGTLVMLLTFTGCRFSEGASLKVKNIDWDGKIRIIGTKTNENRVVYFTEPLASRLKELCKDKGEDDLVFLNAKDNKINPQDFASDLKKRKIKTGITKRVFPHNFRHSYATHMLEAGVPITEVATLLGHKDIQTTYDNYMHLADKTLQKAAMRHPMVRQNVNPKDIVKNIKEILENLHLERDTRFKYLISEKDDSLNFELLIN